MNFPTHLGSLGNVSIYFRQIGKLGRRPWKLCMIMCSREWFSSIIMRELKSLWRVAVVALMRPFRAYHHTSSFSIKYDKFREKFK
jgi:hypothetical protein